MMKRIIFMTCVNVFGIVVVRHVGAEGRRHNQIGTTGWELGTSGPKDAVLLNHNGLLYGDQTYRRISVLDPDRGLVALKAHRLSGYVGSTERNQTVIVQVNPDGTATRLVSQSNLEFGLVDNFQKVTIKHGVLVGTWQQDMGRTPGGAQYAPRQFQAIIHVGNNPSHPLPPYKKITPFRVNGKVVAAAQKEGGRATLIDPNTGAKLTDGEFDKIWVEPQDPRRFRNLYGLIGRRGRVVVGYQKGRGIRKLYMPGSVNK